MLLHLLPLNKLFIIIIIISVRRGVPQRDCLSPLLFNLCFNIFIQFIKAETYQHLGFSIHDGNGRMFQPVHWFQFADDAAVIISCEKENQTLLICFKRWCQLANFVIRIDKCCESPTTFCQLHSVPSCLSKYTLIFT